MYSNIGLGFRETVPLKEQKLVDFFCSLTQSVDLLCRVGFNFPKKFGEHFRFNGKFRQYNLYVSVSPRKFGQIQNQEKVFDAEKL